MSKRETVHSSTALELGVAILQQLPRDITQEVALEWIRNKKALGKGLREMLMPQVSPTILEHIGTVELTTQEAFRAVDFFKEKGQPGGIKMWLGDTFKNHFLNGTGKIELDIPACSLNVYQLSRQTLNDQIITVLGGRNAIKTCLAYLAQLIKAQQPEGMLGDLLTNGRANIWYVEDDNGELWVVYCYWRPGFQEWYVEARPVKDLNAWGDDCLVFSPAILDAA